MPALRMRVIGGLRVGERKLYVYHPLRGLSPVLATCVLDFFVHEEYQGLRFGKALFQVKLPIIPQKIIQSLSH